MDSDQSFGGASDFITKCKTELKWEDLSKDTVMDIGCGYHYFYCRAILDQFPNIGCLIANDKYASVLETRLFEDPMFESHIKNKKVQFHAADIEDRNSFEKYKESIDKVLSRNVFYQIENKELAFKNIYHMLKPGGNAAFLFWLDNPMGAWHVKMLSMRKWAKYVDKSKLVPSYIAGKLESDYYKNMMETIGFREVRPEIHNLPILYRNDEICLGELLKIGDATFNIPPERKDEFKDDSLKLFKRLVGCNKIGPIRYTIVELYLFAVKPSNSDTLEEKSSSS